MNLIKAKFLRDGEPFGREYTYQANEVLEIGDKVQLNERGVGIITEINVPESEVESFKDKLKTIIGKIKLDETEPFETESDGETV
jgi:uncharacterized Zn finger protein